MCVVFEFASMPRNNSVFGQDTACVRLIGIVAFAGNFRAALAAWLSVPCPIGMVFADPPYAKTNRTLFIHGIETRGPPVQKSRVCRAPPPFSEMSRANPILFERRQLNCRPFDQFLQFVFRDTKLLRPVIYFPCFVHVYPVAVRRTFFLEVIHVAPPKGKHD